MDILKQAKEILPSEVDQEFLDQIIGEIERLRNLSGEEIRSESVVK